MKVIAIQNYGPSGTTLLHSLLDNHPQILSMPALYPIGFYTSWRDFVATKDLDFDTLHAFLMGRLSFLYNPDDIEASWGLKELGEASDQDSCVPKDAFATALTANLRIAGAIDRLERGELAPLRRLVVIAAYLAYEQALGHDCTHKKFLVYPAHSSAIQDLADLVEDFPDIKFLHMIRDPTDLVFSTIKYNKIWQKKSPYLGHLDPFSCAVTQMTLDRTPLLRSPEPFHAIRPITPDLEPNCRAVKLEWLHAAPEVTMKALAEWCGFDWDRVCLESTISGLKWWNRPSLRRISGFNKDMPSVPGVAAFDRRRMNYILEPVRQYYGYEKEPLRGVAKVVTILGLLRPFEVEADNDPVFAYTAFAKSFPFGKHRRRPTLAALASLGFRSPDSASDISTAFEAVKAATEDAGCAAPSRAEWLLGVLYGNVALRVQLRLWMMRGGRHLRLEHQWVQLLKVP